MRLINTSDTELTDGVNGVDYMFPPGIPTKVYKAHLQALTRRNAGILKVYEEPPPVHDTRDLAACLKLIRQGKTEEQLLVCATCPCIDFIRELLTGAGVSGAAEALETDLEPNPVTEEDMLRMRVVLDLPNPDALPGA